MASSLPSHQNVRTSTNHKRKLAVIVAAWLILVLGGFAVSIQHDARPGASGDPPASWPVASRLKREPKRRTLLMFIHPNCPCTRASLAEFGRVLEGQHDPLAAYAVFVQQPSLQDDRRTKDLWSAAKAIPGLSLVEDRDGSEAARFNVRTSGHVLLYDSGGKLDFSGGVTVARGHVGQSSASDSLVAALNHRGTAKEQPPVFGCPLCDPNDKTCSPEKCERP